MMRRGPLDRYPLLDVLRTAGADAVTGAVEVDATVAGVIFFDQGSVFYAELRDVAPPPAIGAAADAPPDLVSAHVDGVVAALLAMGEGWYRLHRSYEFQDRVADRHRARRPVSVVLDSVAEEIDEGSALRPWRAGLLELGRPATMPAMDDDMWRVVVSVPRRTSVHLLRRDLGWSPERLAAAVDRLAAARVVTCEHGDGEPLITVDGASCARRHSATRVGPEHAGGPTSAGPHGPDADGGRRGALSRLISSLRI